jgi:hypothetical protein
MVKLSRTSRTLGALAGFSGAGVGDAVEPAALGAAGVAAGLTALAAALERFLGTEGFDAGAGADAGRVLAALTGLADETAFDFIRYSLHR